VLAVGGNALSSKGGGTWKHLNAGEQLSNEFKIKIDKNSYAGIIGPNGRSIELTKPGTYESKFLKSLIAGGNPSSSKKFVNFVFSEITKKMESASQMKVTGAVVRERINDIPVGVPSPTYILDSVTVFSWYPVEGTGYYTFKLLNNENKTVYLKRVQDTTISLNLYSLQLNEDSFKWVVINYDKPEQMSDTNLIYMLPASNADVIRDSVENLNDVIGSNPTAINQIILAAFYERNNININAMEAYKRAVKLAPKVKAYRARYNEYLKSKGIDRMIE